MRLQNVRIGLVHKGEMVDIGGAQPAWLLGLIGRRRSDELPFLAGEVREAAHQAPGVSARFGRSITDDPARTSVPEGFRQAGLLMRRAKLALQIDRLIAFGGWNVEDQIAGRELRRGRAHGLRGRRGGNAKGPERS